MNQLNSFLFFILAGLLIGLVFDSFRILRRSIKTTDFITYIEDVLLSIIICIITIISINIFNSGELRLYIFIGMVLGFIIYLLTISKIIISINISILSILLKCFKRIICIVFLPILLIINKIKKIKNVKNFNKVKGFDE